MAYNEASLSPGARKYYRRMKAGYASANASRPSAPSNDLATRVAGLGGNPAPARRGTEPNENPTNPATWILDILSQPVYAATQNAAEVAGGVLGAVNPNRSVADKIAGLAKVSPLDNFGSRNNKKLPSDILRGDAELMGETAEQAGVDFKPTEDFGPLAANDSDNVAQRAAKAAGGFGADVIFDPLSYITLGAGGAALSATRTGLKKAATKVGAEKVVNPVAEGIGKAGEVLTKVDDTLNALPGKVIDKVKGKSKAAVEEKAIKEVVAEAAPKDLDDSAREFIDSLLASPGGVAPRTLAKKGLEDVTSGETIPFDARKAKQTQLRKPDIEHLKDDKGHFPTPFEPAPVSGVSTPRAAIAEAMKQADDAAAIQAKDATVAALKRPTDPIDPDELKSWVRSKSDTPVTVSYATGTKQSTVTKPISQWMEILNSEGRPVTGQRRSAINTAIRKAASAGVQADRQAAVDAAAQAPAREAGKALANGLEAPAAPSVPSSPAEAVQDATDRAAGRSWANKSPGQKQAIRKRYKRALEEEDFNYLFENVANKDMTPAARQAEFVRRLAQLRRGVKTDVPKYKTIYDIQYATQRGADRRIMSQLKDAPEGTEAAKFNAALSQVKTADEILAETDLSLPATDARQAERILTGQNLDEVSRNALKEALGSDYIFDDELGKVPGQMWTGRNPDFLLTTAAQGTARDSAIPGVGHGVNIESYNAKVQMNVYRSILNAVNEEAVGTKFTSQFERAGFLRNAIVPRLKNIEEYLRAHNVEPIAGNAKTGNPLGLGDMFESLGTTEAGRDFLARRVWGGQFGINKKGAKDKAAGTIYVDALLRVMSSILDKIDGTAINAADNNVDMLEAIARSVVKTAESGKWTSDSLKTALTDADKTMISTARQQNPKFTGGVAIEKSSKGGGYPVDVDIINGVQVPTWGKNSNVILNELMEVLFGTTAGKEDFRAITALAQGLQNRAATHGMRFGDSVRQLTAESMDEVMDFLDGTPSLSESINLLSDPDKMISRIGKAHPIKPTVEEVWAAQQRVAEDLTDVISLWDQRNLKAFRAITAGVDKGSKSAKNKGALQVMDEVARQIDLTQGSGPVQMSIRDAQVQDLTTVMRRAGLWITDHHSTATVVDPQGKITANRLYEGFAESGSMNQNWSMAVARDLNAINRMGTRAEIAIAYKMLQGGSVAVAEPKIMAIRDALDKVNQQFFDKVVKDGTASDGVLPDFFNRGFDLGHIRAKMEANRFEFTKGESFDWDAIESIKDPRKKIEELHRQWTDDLVISDPVNFLGKMSATLSNINADMSMSQSAWKKLSELSLVSPKFKPGFVKLKDTQTNNLTRYFPEEDYWIDKSVIPELQKLNRLLTTSVNFNGGVMGPLTRVYDPILNMWKSGVTIWRPGHHVRNLIGDMTLSFLSDGVKDPRHYFTAAKMLGNRARYDGIDMLRITQGIPVDKVHGGSTGKMTVDLGGGRKTKVSLDQIYDAMYKRSLIKDFSVQEDIIEQFDTPKAIKNFQASRLGQPLRGRGREFVGTLSQGRDDLVRMAHVFHLLENKGGIAGVKAKHYSSLDDMFDAIAARVNKSHPDGTGLTPTERKYYRRLIPFYSWMRKSIPLIIEAAVQHPSRVLIMPKASYNLAQANGIEPDSMSDPFPEDQMFPSWITDKVSGPVYQNADGEYYGIAPGEVSSDFMNQFLTGNAGAEIMDSLNPFIKTPIELQTGVTLGKNIHTPGDDPIQYIGSQIPGVSHIQSLFGTDVLGSVGTVARGEGLDPTLSVQRENRGEIEGSNFLNFILGLGAQNYSTNSVKNAAELEAREKAKNGS